MLKNIGGYEFNEDSWLGTGSFATVYKGTHRISKEVVAIKEINIRKLRMKHGGLDEQKIIKSLTSEINTMRLLNHPNILRLENVIYEGDSVYMLVEYCSGGDIVSYMKSRKGMDLRGIGEENARKISIQIMSGLKHMHSLGIVHRDLKPQNILLSQPISKTTNPNWDGVTVKIADFGFARTLSSTQLTETICGSPMYMAPEILGNHKYTDNADLWSMGVILYEMLVGCPPFPAKSIMDLVRMYSVTTEVQLPIYINATKQCRDLVSSLLIVDARKRISWDDFFKHPWLVSEQNFIAQKQDETIIGSAPARLQMPHQHEDALLESFEIITDGSQQFETEKKPSCNKNEDEMIIELCHWNDISKTLIKLGESKWNLKYYIEGYVIYNHVVRTLKIVLETAISFIQKTVNMCKSVTTFAEIPREHTMIPHKGNAILIENVTDDRLKLLILQINASIQKCKYRSEDCRVLITMGVHCKTTEKLIMDTAISFGRQGKVYTDIENPRKAEEFYVDAAHLLESIIPFSNKDVKITLNRYIKFYNKRVEALREGGGKK